MFKNLSLYKTSDIRHSFTLIFLLAFSQLACSLAAGSANQGEAPDQPSQAVIDAAVATVEAKHLAQDIPSNFPDVQGAPILSENAPVIQESLIALFRRLGPSVVHIFGPFGSGSGFVYDDQGHIVTNNHVIEGSTNLEVVFADGQRRAATVLAADVDSDLAVLLVDNLPPNIEPIPLGDSSQVEVGQVVVAIGNPFGERSSMSMGIISGLGRSINSQRQGYSLPQVLQTDAPINPGNSGGPLLDLSGRVVGVNSAIRSATGVNSGVGFAIPVNAVHRIIPSLIEDGIHHYPYLGIQVSGLPITLEAQEQLSLPQTTGAYIVDVAEGSPADDAGLIGSRGPGGDLIIAIDGQPVQEFNDLLSYLVFETEVGQTVELTVLRGSEEISLSATLSERP
jgi:2-alkenal reductase